MVQSFERFDIVDVSGERALVRREITDDDHCDGFASQRIEEVNHRAGWLEEWWPLDEALEQVNALDARACRGCGCYYPGVPCDCCPDCGAPPDRTCACADDHEDADRYAFERQHAVGVL